MNTAITTKNLDLTPKIRRLINQKTLSHLDKLLSRYPPDLKDATLHLEYKKPGTYLATFNMAVTACLKLHASSSADNLVSCLVNLREQLEKQILRHKSS